MMDSPLVDCHFHIYTVDLPLVGTAWHKPTVDASTERLIETFDTHGVTFGVVAAASLHGTYNDYVRAALRKHRRLRASAIISPEIDDDELRAMDADGFNGIRFQWRNLKDPPDLSSDGWRRTLRRLADLNWHVHLNDMGPRLAATIPVLENAGVKLVLDHFGRPDPAVGINCEGFQAVLRALDRGKAWVKLSAGFRVRAPSTPGELAEHLLKATHGERLVWGSDWPFTNHEDRVTYADTLAALQAWVPDATMRRRITGETPLKLYFA